MVITLTPMAEWRLYKIAHLRTHNRQGTHLSETERIEQLPLVPVDPSHHRPPPPTIALRRWNPCSQMTWGGFGTRAADEPDAETA